MLDNVKCSTIGTKHYSNIDLLFINFSTLIFEKADNTLHYGYWLSRQSWRKSKTYNKTFVCR